MQRAIYLDYAATTPVDPQVAETMMGFLGTDGIFGNPASRTHRFGWEAEKAVENARQELAGLINAEPDEVIWASGATESDNLAIKGVANAYADRGRHIVTSTIEHKAVLDSCRYLEGQGYDVTYLKPSIDGVISPDQVSAALRSDTILVSLMHVNNELGTVTDIQAIAEITRERKIPFHVDAAQSAARLTLDMQSIQADLLSLSGHKMYGPKGIGALYVRRNPRTRLEAQIHGGGHERGMRSGTLPTHQIVGMGEAARLVREQFESDLSRICLLSKRLMGRLSLIEQLSVNGKRRHCVPGIINVTIASVESESLIMMLKGNIAISTGSACTSASVKPSHVLMALGVDEEAAHSSLRLSLGRFTTVEEIDYAAEQITGAVDELRSISPTWIEHRNRIEA
ncbi:MAG: IscS subfamily cysteine desulfurase [Chloroflexi bacterium]|nr:IscS subfamily cysteine desulfurase [Chloroflexota bacterium]